MLIEWSHKGGVKYRNGSRNRLSFADILHFIESFRAGLEEEFAWLYCCEALLIRMCTTTARKEKDAMECFRCFQWVRTPVLVGQPCQKRVHIYSMLLRCNSAESKRETLNCWTVEETKTYTGKNQLRWCCEVLPSPAIQRSARNNTWISVKCIKLRFNSINSVSNWPPGFCVQPNIEAVDPVYYRKKTLATPHIGF